MINPKGSGAASRKRVLRLCYMAVLTALAVSLIALIHFPIFPAVSFLEYDPGDIPMLLGGYMLGPVPGLVISAVVCVIQAFALGGNGVYGMIMHFLASGTAVFVSSLIYKKHRTRKGAAASLIFGALSWTLIMMPANLLITPAFMGTTAQIVWELMPFILLFNFVKSAINCLIVFLIYKPLRRLLDKGNLCIDR